MHGFYLLHVLVRAVNAAVIFFGIGILFLEEFTVFICRIKGDFITLGAKTLPDLTTRLLLIHRMLSNNGQLLARLSLLHRYTHFYRLLISIKFSIFDDAPIPNYNWLFLLPFLYGHPLLLLFSWLSRLSRLPRLSRLSRHFLLNDLYIFLTLRQDERVTLHGPIHLTLSETDLLGHDLTFASISEAIFLPIEQFLDDHGIFVRVGDGTHVFLNGVIEIALHSWVIGCACGSKKWVRNGLI